MTRNRSILAAAAVFIAVLIGLLVWWQTTPTEPMTASGEAEPKAVTTATDAAPKEDVATSDEPKAVPDASASSGPSTPPPASSAPATSAPATLTPPVQEAAAPPSSDEPKTEVPPAQTASTSAVQTAPAEPSATPALALVPPDFDVVRVETNGDAVLAGRAAAGSEVSILDGGTSIGSVDADGRGQWVYVVTPPLAPGSHELSLESRLSDGRVVVSPNVVVVNVPSPQVAAAPQASPQQPATDTSAATAAAPAPPASATAPTASAEVTQPAKPAQLSSAAQPAAQAAEKLVPETSTAEKALAVLVPRTGQGPSQVLQQSVSPQKGLAEGSLALESIDYDETGAIIGGRAAPGTRLIVYLDNAALGETAADASGRWSVHLDRPLTTGLHSLRVDAVDASGKVTARVETPFSRAALAEALPDETSVIVQPGNSLWRIARRVYGEGVRYSLIFEANRGQISDADLIYPGQIFKVPMTTPAAATSN